MSAAEVTTPEVTTTPEMTTTSAEMAASAVAEGVGLVAKLKARQRAVVAESNLCFGPGMSASIPPRSQ